MTEKRHAPIAKQPTIAHQHRPVLVEDAAGTRIRDLTDHGHDPPALGGRRRDLKGLGVPGTAVGRFAKVGGVDAHHVEARGRFGVVAVEVDTDGGGLAVVVAGVGEGGGGEEEEEGKGEGKGEGEVLGGEEEVSFVCLVVG